MLTNAISKLNIPPLPRVTKKVRAIEQGPHRLRN